MQPSSTNVIPFACARAPHCRCCGLRMGLVRSQIDPNGERYMFEMYECRSCNDRRLNVRPIRYSEASRVYVFRPLRRFRPTG